MVRLEGWMDVLDLLQQGCSISEVSRRTGLSRVTIRLLLRHGGPRLRRLRTTGPGVVGPFLPFLRTQLQRGVTSGPVLLRLAQEHGYTGALRTLQNALKPWREERAREPVIRFETAPGVQAQADFAEILLLDAQGVRHRLYCFVVVLGYSRYLYAEFTSHQRLAAVQGGLLRAFAAFGGIPQEVLFDNMKTVVLARSAEDIRWNPAFTDFAQTCGFTPRLCRPYRAQTKGKCERSIRYLRQSFLPGLVFTSLDDLNGRLQQWLSTVANARVHGTTGRIPGQVLAEERLVALAHPIAVQGATLWRMVGRDCFVTYRQSRYSVPLELAGQRVLVREDGPHLVVEHDGIEVARHALVRERYRVIVAPEHFARWRERRDRQLLHLPETTLAGGWPNSRAWPEVERRSLTTYEEVIR